MQPSAFLVAVSPRAIQWCLVALRSHPLTLSFDAHPTLAAHVNVFAFGVFCPARVPPRVSVQQACGRRNCYRCLRTLRLVCACIA